MDMTWYGLSCFRFMERGRASIVTDPYDASMGPVNPRLKGDIVTSSHNTPGHNAYDTVNGAEHFLFRPGEYEIAGIFVTGVATFDKKNAETTRYNVVYTYDFDGVTVCHLGDLDHVPTQSQIEALGTVDVLLIPVGGGGALNSGQASDVISLFEPSIAIPMHYHLPGFNLDLDPLDRFLKEMGVSQIEKTDSLRISASSLSEETQIVVLTPQE